jgi:hypothetical protein
MDNKYPPELSALYSLLNELARRGHRLRCSKKEAAQSENLLAGNPDGADPMTEVVHDQSSS